MLNDETPFFCEQKTFLDNTNTNFILIYKLIYTTNNATYLIVTSKEIYFMLDFLAQVIAYFTIKAVSRFTAQLVKIT